MQGKKKIEEYSDEFLRLLHKIDPNTALPVPMIIKKYIRGLNPKIAPLIYASNPATLGAAMDEATRLATGFELTAGPSKVNQVHNDEIAELREQIANLALVDQMRSDEKKNDILKSQNSDWSGRTSWTESVPRLNRPYEIPLDTNWH